MAITDLPGMLFSEEKGWTEIERSHFSHRWFFKALVLPMALLPPMMYAYAEMSHPGVIFPLTLPALTPGQLLVMGIVFYLAQLAMVAFMAMLIQRMAMGRDHDPGYDAAFALAAIAPVPLWLGSLAMLVPSLGFNLAVGLAALVASIALVRHGVRPILHINDEKLAHYIADMVTMAGMAAAVGLVLVAGMVLSILLGDRTV